MCAYEFKHILNRNFMVETKFKTVLPDQDGSQKKY